MKISEIYKTKDNRKVEFVIKEDSEGDENRGWIVHKIDAFVESVNVGYIKISYIPKERFKEHYPTIFSYESKIQGRSTLPFKYESVHYKNLSLDNLRYMVKKLGNNGNWGFEVEYDFKSDKNYIGEECISDMNRETLLFYIEKAEKSRKGKESQKKFRKFFNFHVNKPIVDYIRVYDGLDGLKQIHKSFQRLGIGTALYLKASEFLKSKGLVLRASGIQQDEAQQAWKKFERLGYVSSDKDRRRYLDPKKIRGKNGKIR